MLGTYGPEQALIPGAAFVCALLPKNVLCSFRKIPVFHTSLGSDLCPTQTQVLQASLGATEGNTSQGFHTPGISTGQSREVACVHAELWLVMDSPWHSNQSYAAPVLGLLLLL